MVPRFISRERFWFLACELVFLSAIVSFTVPHCYALTAFGDLSQCCLLLAVLFSVFPNIQNNEKRARLFWILVSIGFVLWACAQILWTYYEVYLRREVPNPFVGDIVLFLHLVPLMGALALRPDADLDTQNSTLGVVDFTLLFAWWIYLYVFLVIPWQYISPNEERYGRSFDVVYNIEHLTFLLCAGIAWWRSKGGWKTVYGHLFGAGLLYAAGSVSAGVAINLDKYYTGSYYDLPLVGAMAWFAGVGWTARRLPLRTEPMASTATGRNLWFSGLAMATILSMPIMTAFSLFVSHAPTRVRIFRIALTLITMMVLGTLIWIKQHRSDKELVRINRDLREESLTDLLTGARNRRYLSVSIDADLRQVVRSYSPAAPAQSKRNRDLAFYLIDTDSFKQVNDRHGHAMGDKLLVEMARRISSAIRHSDVLIRWGGDEFLVVSRYTDRNDCSILASRVLKFVGGEPFELAPGVRVNCTCSIGWAVFPWYVLGPEKIDYQEILRLADSALYEAKKAGKNQAVGMLPSRENPAVESGKSDDRFAAKPIVTPGPVKAVLSEKAAAATQGA